jgi:hypothetical protein
MSGNFALTCPWTARRSFFQVGAVGQQFQLKQIKLIEITSNQEWSTMLMWQFLF